MIEQFHGWYKKSCAGTTSISFNNLSNYKYLVITASRTLANNPDVSESVMLYLKSFTGCSILHSDRLTGNTNTLILICTDLSNDISMILNTYGTADVSLCYFAIK